MSQYGSALTRRTFLQGVVSRPPVRPNVLFVLVDQWRAQSCGYSGDTNAHTPALDRFARESVNFANAVSGCSVCSPYRASLMTGQYPLRHGVFINDVPLVPNGPTLPQVFATAGYRTGYIGKWHLFGSPDGKFGRRLAYIPKDSRFGFDYWKACECTHNYNKSLYYAGDDPSTRYWPGYDAIAQTEDACEFIRGAKKGEPYFLLLSLGPPHDPYGTAPEKYRAMYEAREIQLRRNVPEAEREAATKALRGYYAHIAALDECLGKLLTAVDDETLVVFASDHGDMLGSQGLRLKQKPWDESIRVPFLVRYPRKFGKKGRAVRGCLDAPDVMPTLLGLTGLPIPESVQGRDFSALPPSEYAALLNLPASFSNVRGYGIGEYRGLRTERYTYVRALRGPWLLYDNRTDPFQMKNLVGRREFEDVRSKMDRMLDARLRALGDDFLPGDRYIERARLGHYREATVTPGKSRSPWGDWESTM